MTWTIPVLFWSLLAASDAGPGRVELPRRSVSLPGMAVTVLAISPDARRAAAGSMDKLTRVVDLETGKVLSTLSGALTGVTALAFSPDGKRLAVGDRATQVLVYEWETGTRLGQWSADDAVQQLSYSADGEALMAVTLAGVASVFEAGKVEPRCRASYLKSARANAGAEPGWVGFSSRGQFVQVGRDCKLKGKSVRAAGLSASVPQAHVADRSGAAITYSTRQKNLEVWNSQTGKRLRSLEGHERGVSSAALSADGRWAMSSVPTGTARLWEVESGQVAAKIPVQGAAVVAISEDGRAAAVADGTVLTVLQNELARPPH